MIGFTRRLNAVYCRLYTETLLLLEWEAVPVGQVRQQVPVGRVDCVSLHGVLSLVISFLRYTIGMP